MADKKNTREFVCKKCGNIFIQNCKNGGSYSYCPYCYNALKKAREEQIVAEERRIEEERWRDQNIIDKKRFEDKLLKMSTIPIEELSPQGRILYIIGNGFDLMHGVKSSYRAFRDYLGKNSSLRSDLELYLRPDDIWADFEEALGHINIDMMANSNVVNHMLENSGFYEEDSGAAEYYVALEVAAAPMRNIIGDLEKQFRMWIENLEIGTYDRPLKTLFHDDKVLCFNYTEFVEELYGVSESNVCYIHGCRRKKGYQKERLILGHKPGASEEGFISIRNKKREEPYSIQFIDVVQGDVLDLLSEYDKYLTKNSQAIITIHRAFFESIREVENVIVIGHSISPVDWDYFLEVDKNAPDANWFFGCHGIHDLENMQHLSDELGKDPIVFRTDGIAVTKIPESERVQRISRLKPKRIQSPDQNWNVQWTGKKISIISDSCQLKRIMRNDIRKCFFSSTGDIVFVIIEGYNTGIPFFRLVDEAWVYVDELESFSNENLINSGLRHVYLNGEEITLVYNNRIREYSLETGELVRNQRKKNAKCKHYDGEEITKLFF